MIMYSDGNFDLDAYECALKAYETYQSSPKASDSVVTSEPIKAHRKPTASKMPGKHLRGFLIIRVLINKI